MVFRHTHSYVTITTVKLKTSHHPPEKLCTHQQPPSPPLPAAGATFCLHGSAGLGRSMSEVSETCVVLRVPPLSMSQNPSMQQLLSVLCSFLLLNNTSCTDISHIINTFVSSQTFELFLVLATRKNATLKICVKFLYRHVFSLLLNIYLGVKLLGHMVILC